MSEGPEAMQGVPGITALRDALFFTTEYPDNCMRLSISPRSTTALERL